MHVETFVEPWRFKDVQKYREHLLFGGELGYDITGYNEQFQ